MNCVKNHFLGKEYSFPEDILIYMDLVEFTNGIRDSLIASFNKQIAQDIAVLENDNFMVKEINDQVSKFIAKLLQNNVYDKVAADYLRNNKGYDLFLRTKKKVIAQILAIRKEKLDTFSAGVQDALYKKDVSVTGLDFGIISSSFVNHMIYAYMDASKQVKQEREALEVYNREIAALKQNAKTYDVREKNYITQTVIPTMNSVFTYFAFDLLDKYVADLIRVGQFDKTALSYIDLKRSNDLLNNLSLSDNKKAIIEHAFWACPYNVAVYVQAIKNNLMDDASYRTANYFKRFDPIVTEAYKLRSEGKHLEAFTLCEGLAALGHARALFCVGNIFWRGLDMERDFDKARYYFEKAAEQKHTGALNNLGQMYELGDGVEKNGERAAELYLAASNAGGDVACVASQNLAILYDFGKLIPQNHALALKYYHLALDQGSTSDVVLNNLGVLYMDGKGTPKDWNKALKYLSLSAEKGNAQGKNNLRILKSNIQARENAQKELALKETKKQTLADKLKGFFR